MAWNKSNEIFTYDLHSGPTVVFAGDTTSGGPPHYAPGQWHTIDLKPLGVSADAKFAEINGFLIITDVNSQIDNLTATFRSPSSTLDAGNYQMQAISVFSGDGARQVQSVTVALENGCLQFYWQKTVGGVPENGDPSSFLLNLRLEKWGRYEAAADLTALTNRVTATETVNASQDAEINSLNSAIAAIPDYSASIASILTRLDALETSPPPPSTPTVINVPPGGVTIQFVQGE